jgi:hypothetical protein
MSASDMAARLRDVLFTAAADIVGAAGRVR